MIGTLKSIPATSRPNIGQKATQNQDVQAQVTLVDEEEERKALRQFERNLKQLGTPSVTIKNDVDGSTPPLDFRFVSKSILGPGVLPTSDEFMIGCDCRPENGRHCGCEYLYCTCLEEAATINGRKAFPYSVGPNDRKCLRSPYLKSRCHIYECNEKCNCKDNCKNRVVQFGRVVELEIFKTEDRGFGKLVFSTLRSLLILSRLAMFVALAEGPIR